jgi:murein DD-endopeptidase MepM/ murein hydrolase activator NlpD
MRSKESQNSTMHAARLGLGVLALSVLVPSFASAAPIDAGKLDEPESSPIEIVAASPVPTGIRLAGHFGHRTGRSGTRQFHAGVDFAAPRGTPVYSVARGIIAHVAGDRDRHTRFGGYGNAVVVYHPDQDVWTLYAHLQSVRVVEGQSVDAGAWLGRSGATTNRRFVGMGPHLHFEVRERARDGREPFPGAYGSWNLDPREWLAEMGLQYGRDGFLRTDDLEDPIEVATSEAWADVSYDDHDESEHASAADEPEEIEREDLAKAMPWLLFRRLDESVADGAARLLERIARGADGEAEIDAVTHAG